MCIYKKRFGLLCNVYAVAIQSRPGNNRCTQLTALHRLLVVGVPLAPSDILKVLVASEKPERYSDQMVRDWNECRSLLVKAELKEKKNAVGKKVSM